MLRQFCKRFAPASVVVTMILLGSSTGYLLGRQHLQQATYERLQEEAEMQDGPFLDLIDEVQARFQNMSPIAGKNCTPEDLIKFQEISIGSRNLKDAGWMHNGQLICSGVFGRHPESIQLPAPVITRADGLKIIHQPFQERPPFDSKKYRTFLFTFGDAYIVGTPDRYNRPKRTRSFEIESTLFDQVSGRRQRPSAMPVLHPEAVLDQDWRGQLGDLFYITLCRPKEQLCTSAFEPFSLEMRDNFGLLLIDATLGGTLGIIFAMAILFYLSRRRSLPRLFRRAVRSGSIQMVYQPIVEISTGRIVEAEALLRWKLRKREAISPELLVRIAEKYGFIHELTEQVLKRVLPEVKEAICADSDFRININICVANIEDPRFLSMVDRELARAAIAPHHLAFEITEGSTARKEKVCAMIHQFRERGIGVKIDDFGTGYSSLVYLKELCVDAIKIDKAFTQAIGTDTVSVVILPQILQMARELNLRTIAEGIETAEQEGFYRESGEGILGQGWYYGRPAPALQFLATLAGNRAQQAASAGADGECSAVSIDGF
jgi:sensor c-di-GMP phosphodiesterase-like protein